MDRLLRENEEFDISHLRVEFYPPLAPMETGGVLPFPAGSLISVTSHELRLVRTMALETQPVATHLGAPGCERETNRGYTGNLGHHWVPPMEEGGNREP